MSRAYRIEVRESETRTLRASDEIGTCLELLEILPGDEMAELLRAQLAKKGFADEQGKLTRKNGDTTITVDPCNGEVIIKTESEKSKELEVKKVGHAIDDIRGSGQAVKTNLTEKAKLEINEKAERELKALQAEVSAELEKSLKDFQPELGEIVNQVTREALKKKAAQLGRIQDLTEDEATGSMTITVEV